MDNVDTMYQINEQGMILEEIDKLDVNEVNGKMQPQDVIDQSLFEQVAIIH
ncbi:MAG: hypothetical protein SV375_07205 [Thermodesulfobacteriota bacterium]|nr:hypothetical protein [Thermodesulfobacteriota bacterium]